LLCFFKECCVILRIYRTVFYYRGINEGTVSGYVGLQRGGGGVPLGFLGFPSPRGAQFEGVRGVFLKGWWLVVIKLSRSFSIGAFRVYILF